MPSNPNPVSKAPSQAKKKRVSLYERRRTVWGVLAGMLVLNLVVVFFTLRPSGLSLPQQKAELARLKEDRDSVRATVGRLERVQGTLLDSGKQGQEFVNSKFLPVETGFATIM